MSGFVQDCRAVAMAMSSTLQLMAPGPVLGLFEESDNGLGFYRVFRNLLLMVIFSHFISRLEFSCHICASGLLMYRLVFTVIQRCLSATIQGLSSSSLSLLGLRRFLHHLHPTQPLPFSSCSRFTSGTGDVGSTEG